MVSYHHVPLQVSSHKRTLHNLKRNASLASNPSQIDNLLLSFFLFYERGEGGEEPLRVDAGAKFFHLPFFDLLLERPKMREYGFRWNLLGIAQDHDRVYSGKF